MPKKTIEAIVDTGNHYIIQIKGNQPSLLREIQRAMVQQTPLDYYEEHQKDHGRHSWWQVSIFEASLSIKTSEWKNLHRFIHVHKRTVSKKGESHSDRLYISDLFETSACHYHQAIRGHWKIENSLHWVKDVVHNEDGNQITKGNGPVNSAVFSSIAINIHRKNGNWSITNGQIKFAANVKELFKFLRT